MRINLTKKLFKFSREKNNTQCLTFYLLNNFLKIHLMN